MANVVPNVIEKKVKMAEKLPENKVENINVVDKEKFLATRNCKKKVIYRNKKRTIIFSLNVTKSSMAGNDVYVCTFTYINTRELKCSVIF